MRTYRTITATAALTLAASGALLAAPTAQAQAQTTIAATLLHEDGELWYRAAAGQTNDLTVTGAVEDRSEFESFYVLTFRDRGDIAIDAEAATWDECAYPEAGDHTVARCAVEIPQNSDDSDTYDVDLGDGDDTATTTGDADANGGIHGGEGDDVLHGSIGDMLYGEDGNDSLDGGGGIWSISSYGGAGDDTLTGCTLECHGGDGDDVLYGGTEEIENTLYGDDGDDVLHGGDGADVLYGGKGNDTLHGDDGDDTLWGNSGDDVLYGGAGDDTLSGGPGDNEVHQD